ncbi:VOC family protein [Bacillus sp. H-16]|uniref:VOC family protein n=1 Tax=Alteribacter salitolerans TaxID=2912333 RepID=UPI0019635002|nr:VOC family protein [Alteribacter salitolerans]MBM7095108.1 VOC family protein [Alteribacter salitolerans]
MVNAIEKEVGAIFVPVKDVEKARDWYRELLGVMEEGEIQFGHIYVIPGTNVVLDSKIFDRRSQGTAPLFHFNTKDIRRAYEECRAAGVEVTSEVENGHWFTFKDPDENVLMVCQC